MLGREESADVPNSKAPFSPELLRPMSIAVPTIVGTRAKMIGTIRSPLRSEYHPQNKVVKAATAPPGVDKIRVCFDLRNNCIHEYHRNDNIQRRDTYVYPNPLIIKLLTRYGTVRLFFGENSRMSLTVAQATVRDTC